MILREQQEIQLTQIKLDHHNTYWDNRFIIECSKSEYSVGKLTLLEYIQKRRDYVWLIPTLIVNSNLFYISITGSLQKFSLLSLKVRFCEVISLALQFVVNKICGKTKAIK